MKSFLEARVLALVVAAAAGAAAAQTPELRAGVSVQMAVTSNAVAVPDADRGDSLIVAVTRAGNAYLEITPVDPAALRDKLRSALARRVDKTVFLKGDARAPFAAVAKYTEAIAMAGADPAVLLTDQHDSSDAGKRPVPPKGLEVAIGGALASEPITIEARSSGQGSPALKIDNEPTSLASLRAAIAQRLRNGRVVVVKAAGSLAFGDVVKVVDACRPAGAKIYLIPLGG